MKMMNGQTLSYRGRRKAINAFKKEEVEECQGKNGQADRNDENEPMIDDNELTDDKTASLQNEETDNAKDKSRITFHPISHMKIKEATQSIQMGRYLSQCLCSCLYSLPTNLCL